MSQVKRASEFMKFLKTLLLGGVLGTTGTVALLLFGPPRLRGLFLSTQPQPTPASVALSPSPVSSLTPSPDATSSPTPAAQPPKPVTFEDIAGSFGEKEITQLAELGVFDTTTGKFNSQQPITRAEFVRWLIKANNAIWSSPDQIIREAEGGQAKFTDVPPTHPNFRYIQGLFNTGFVSGFDETAFGPDRPLSREQMIAIKIGVDRGGVYNFQKLEEDWAELNTKLGRNVPSWSDREQISKRFIPAFNSEYYKYLSFSGVFLIEGNSFKNVDRTFGVTAVLKPQQPVTRAEAAVCLSLFGEHTQDSDHFRTAELALKEKTK
jgi:hypothetical protein